LKALGASAQPDDRLALAHRLQPLCATKASSLKSSPHQVKDTEHNKEKPPKFRSTLTTLDHSSGKPRPAPARCPCRLTPTQMGGAQDQQLLSAVKMYLSTVQLCVQTACGHQAVQMHPMPPIKHQHHAYSAIQANSCAHSHTPHSACLPACRMHRDVTHTRSCPGYAACLDYYWPPQHTQN
jgi:hypothetical protein